MSLKPSSSHRFKDRHEAGIILGKQLLEYKNQPDVVVYALPRGGVPVGYEVARLLNVPLDVFIVRKVGAPGQRELGVGAVASGGVSVYDEATLRALGITVEDVKVTEAEELVELERREQLYRGVEPPIDVCGKTVIVVDDGLATGVTARSALKALHKLGAVRLVLAVPVCATRSAETIRQEEADEVVCALMRDDFMAVGYWYEDFSQTTDEEVLELLLQNRQQMTKNGLSMGED